MWFNQRLVSLSALQKPLRAVGLLVPGDVHVLLVQQQPAVEEEGLPAQVTHERLPGTVDEHVGLQLVVVRVARATILAGERLLTRVNAKVPLEVVVQVEPCSAYVTGEWFLPCVDDAVPLQRGAGPVRPVAHGARERGDAGVFPLVHRQGVGIFESLLAHCALVFFGFRVNHLMEAESVFALELLAAFITAERPLLRVHGHVTPHLDWSLAGLVAKVALQDFLPLLVAREVVLQRLLDSESSPTLVADKRLRRLQLLVPLEVILERLLFPERSFTLWTGEGPGDFARLVAQKVILQRLLQHEAPVTPVTRKWLRVDLHVFVQITFHVETNVTMLAKETLRRQRIFIPKPVTWLDCILSSAVVSGSHFNFKSWSPHSPRPPRRCLFHSFLLLGETADHAGV